ncbi:hypothetical protein CHISP_3710 [Chitinispirillum alkaliphilum]|nr:hypothetical protein CHISP_3710 [Chitinispirillum alkaliphilum]
MIKSCIGVTDILDNQGRCIAWSSGCLSNQSPINGRLSVLSELRAGECFPYCLKGTPQFKRAKVENGTVVWSCEIDMAPENLYNESVLISSGRVGIHPQM